MLVSQLISLGRCVRQFNLFILNDITCLAQFLIFNEHIDQPLQLLQKEKNEKKNYMQDRMKRTTAADLHNTSITAEVLIGLQRYHKLWLTHQTHL